MLNSSLPIIDFFHLNMIPMALYMESMLYFIKKDMYMWLKSEYIVKNRMPQKFSILGTRFINPD